LNQSLQRQLPVLAIEVVFDLRLVISMIFHMLSDVDESHPLLFERI